MYSKKGLIIGAAIGCLLVAGLGRVEAKANSEQWQVRRNLSSLSYRSE